MSQVQVYVQILEVLQSSNDKPFHLTITGTAGLSTHTKYHHTTTSFNLFNMATPNNTSQQFTITTSYAGVPRYCVHCQGVIYQNEDFGELDCGHCWHVERCLNELSRIHVNSNPHVDCPQCQIAVNLWITGFIETQMEELARGAIESVGDYTSDHPTPTDTPTANFEDEIAAVQASINRQFITAIGYQGETRFCVDCNIAIGQNDEICYIQGVECHSWHTVCLNLWAGSGAGTDHPNTDCEECQFAISNWTTSWLSAAWEAPFQPLDINDYELSLEEELAIEDEDAQTIVPDFFFSQEPLQTPTQYDEHDPVSGEDPIDYSQNITPSDYSSEPEARNLYPTRETPPLPGAHSILENLNEFQCPHCDFSGWVLDVGDHIREHHQ